MLPFTFRLGGMYWEQLAAAPPSAAVWASRASGDVANNQIAGEKPRRNLNAVV
jgi:hypothetical protein